MRVLGIDPGIARTGWGIIEENNGKFSALDYDCLETSPNLETPKRLFEIYDKVIKLINKYKVDALSVEELFFNTNAKTAFVVGQARGVVLLAGAQKKLSIGIYTPLQVKIAVSGYGRAEKVQIGKMVKTILNLKEIPRPDDTADALAVGLTHLFSRKIGKYDRKS
ncbi:MAG: crossover junction endodeoxyribonuclease RuvC [Candidatus Levybacteria bacterium]|nr:crossover junction endodeoxyribonuclease RuvC [Candidatus Levybacteria bacterium]